jgi:ABC-type phosphate transport system substrate-binding protein
MTQEYIATLIGGPLGTLIITTIMKAITRWAGAEATDLAAVALALAGAVACGLLLGLYPPAAQTPLSERVLIGLGGATALYKVLHEIAKREGAKDE